MHYFKNNKYYFINKFDTNNIDKQDKSTIIIYRNYSEKKINKLLILKIKNYCKIIGSAHNLKQIRNKEVQKVEKIFLSSLFKKNKNYLGINKFKLLSKLTMKKVVVLGGISKKNVQKLNLLNNLEFAGISYFE